MSKKTQYDSDDMDHMVPIDTVVADFQKISEKFGNTCVYIRRGGLSWGAVALNRRGDDEKHGVFDLQAQHDRDMTHRAEQVRRMVGDAAAMRDEKIVLLDSLRELLDIIQVWQGQKHDGLEQSDFREEQERAEVLLN